MPVVQRMTDVELEHRTGTQLAVRFNVNALTRATRRHVQRSRRETGLQRVDCPSRRAFTLRADRHARFVAECERLRCARSPPSRGIISLGLNEHAAPRVSANSRYASNSPSFTDMTGVLMVTDTVKLDEMADASDRSFRTNPAHRSQSRARRPASSNKARISPRSARRDPPMNCASSRVMVRPLVNTRIAKPCLRA